MFLIRLDDASECMCIEKWIRMENLLDKYGIKPIYGIIPLNKDPGLLKHEKVNNFWNLMRSWKNKGWTPALHGCTHVFETNEGGLNPVNNRSEYAGVTLDKQEEKIRKGYTILKNHGIDPLVFFAPAHTFDKNTLKAIKAKSPIRIICDTIANDVYFLDDFYFIPQQSGRCRRLPFKLITFCYHPNNMINDDFVILEKFLRKHQKNFSSQITSLLKKRNISTYDRLLRKIYFMRRAQNT